MPKYIITFLALAAIAGLGLFLDADSRLRAGSNNNTPANIDPQVNIIHAAGRVEGATEEAGLLPEFLGRVIKIPVHEGDLVEAGDVLLQLDDQLQRHEESLRTAEVAIAEAELERLVNGARSEERREAAAKHRALVAQLRGARKRLDRAAGLLATNSISQQQFDDFEAEVEAQDQQIAAAQAHLELVEAPAREDEVRRAKAQIAAAKARLELARAQREKMVMRAVAPGTVLEIYAQLGELVRPESDEPALIMVDTRQLFVRAFIEEFDAPQIRPGMVCSVTADGIASAAFCGTVVQVAPRMSKKHVLTDDPDERFDSKVREVWIELEQPGDLLVGLRVDVIFDGGQAAEQPRAQEPSSTDMRAN